MGMSDDVEVEREGRAGDAEYRAEPGFARKACRGFPPVNNKCVYFRLVFLSSLTSSVLD